MRVHVLLRAIGSHPDSAWSVGVEPGQTHKHPCLPPSPVPCPGVTLCCTTLLCYACCVPRRPKAHSGPTASFPAPCLQVQGSCEQKSRCRWGRSVIASSLAAGRHRASVVGKVPGPLRFLLSRLLMHMKKKATDRFMRDTIRCGYGA